MRRYLVVGNQTITSSGLLEVLRARAAAGPSTFHILVPMRHAEATTWSEGAARAAAEARLSEALDHFRAAALDVGGTIGDLDPVAAVADVLIADPGFDEIVVSTLPPGISYWLGRGVPQRIAREHPHTLVTHVVAEPARAK
jgi:GABA permease